MDDISAILPHRSDSRLVANDSGDLEVSGPIIGYAEEPLLPLDQACTPLTGIVHDVLKYVHIALERTPTIPVDGLTHDESASIRLYTMEWPKEHQSLYTILNLTLRADNRDNLQPWFKYLKLFLTALTKLPCAPPQTVWRGVRKNISHAFQSGEQVIWWSFSSCTTNLTVLENSLYLGGEGDRTLFSIELFNGRVIRAHSHFVVEDEILMLPGTLMEVQSKLNPATDLYIIHLKQKIPRTTLLEPPFENAYIHPKIPENIVLNFSKRHRYQQRRFLICISSLVVLFLLAIILGSILGSRPTNKKMETITNWCPMNGWNICVFTTRLQMEATGYYGSEFVDIDCNQALSNITVIITVRKTLGASFTKQYNGFPPNTLIETHTETSSEILYIWKAKSGQIVDFQFSPYYVNAQFQLAGASQLVQYDTYSVIAQVVCNGVILTKTGHF